MDMDMDMDVDVDVDVCYASLSQKGNYMATQAKPKWSGIKLTNEGRTRLRSAIRLEPTAGRYVKSGAEVSKLKKVGLLDLAVKLGIDPIAVIQAEEDPGLGSIEESTGVFAAKPFSGMIEFDFTMSVLGNTVTRKSRIHYTRTPDWAYFDLLTNQDVLSYGEGTSYRLEIQSIVEGVVHYSDEEAVERGRTIRRKGRPDWEQCDDLTMWGIWTDEMWGAIDELIDKDCRRIDQTNRGLKSSQQHSEAK